MYAIIQDGSHQLKVQEGEEIEIDYRKVGAGSQVTLDRVIAVGPTMASSSACRCSRVPKSRPKCSASAAPSSSCKNSAAARIRTARPATARWSPACGSAKSRSANGAPPFSRLFQEPFSADAAARRPLTFTLSQSPMSSNEPRPDPAPGERRIPGFHDRMLHVVEVDGDGPQVDAAGDLHVMPVAVPVGARRGLG